MIVFYHTNDPLYSYYAELLKASLESLGLQYYYEVIESKRWVDAVNIKPAYLLRCLGKGFDHVVYVDCDAFVHSPVSADDFPDRFDIAFTQFTDYITGRQDNLTGTLILRNNERSRLFCQHWAELAKKDSARWDQATFTDALRAAESTTFYHLPLSYTYIFDNPTCQKSVARPVVEHLQASRIAKKGYKKIPKFNCFLSRKIKRTISRAHELRGIVDADGQ